MSRLKYIKFKDILAIFQLFLVLPVALVAKLFIHDFWLICEEKYEARDNGYWLFKYIREKQPKQKVAYAISKKCPDYHKVSELGKTVSFGTWSHWFWYLVASKNISSQKGGKPNAAVCFLFEVKIPLLRTKRYFLQHGVIKDLCDWLFYKNCKFKMFSCGAKPEYEYVAKEYGYPENVVKYLGLTRFDSLHNKIVDKDLILVMPTWREWLSRSTAFNNGLTNEEFAATNYYKYWQGFLENEELHRILRASNKKLLFYPHRNMQKYVECFQSKCENIEIADAKNYDIQQVLKSAALMITDYSSVFFDFAYMKKPVLFYQFDEKEFREKQYREGYFDYHKNNLGKWTDDVDILIEMLSDEIAGNFSENDNIEAFFELYDDKNCERTYLAIKEG